MNNEENKPVESVCMTTSHKPSMNLRFVMRDGKRILQQMFYPNDWNTHDEEWRDIPLIEHVAV